MPRRADLGGARGRARAVALDQGARRLAGAEVIRLRATWMAMAEYCRSASRSRCLRADARGRPRVSRWRARCTGRARSLVIEGSAPNPGDDGALPQTPRSKLALVTRERCAWRPILGPSMVSAGPKPDESTAHAPFARAGSHGARARLVSVRRRSAGVAAPRWRSPSAPGRSAPRSRCACAASTAAHPFDAGRCRRLRPRRRPRRGLPEHAAQGLRARQPQDRATSTSSAERARSGSRRRSRPGDGGGHAPGRAGSAGRHREHAAAGRARRARHPRLFAPARGLPRRAHALGSARLLLRVGRQKGHLGGGDGRLVGANDWSTTGRSLDAARFGFQAGDFDVETMAAMLATPGRYTPASTAGPPRPAQAPRWPKDRARSSTVSTPCGTRCRGSTSS